MTSCKWLFFTITTNLLTPWSPHASFPCCRLQSTNPIYEAPKSTYPNPAYRRKPADNSGLTVQTDGSMANRPSQSSLNKPLGLIASQESLARMGSITSQDSQSRRPSWTLDFIYTCTGFVDSVLDNRVKEIFKQYSSSNFTFSAPRLILLFLSSFLSQNAISCGTWTRLVQWHGNSAVNFDLVQIQNDKKNYKNTICYGWSPTFLLALRAPSHRLVARMVHPCFRSSWLRRKKNRKNLLQPFLVAVKNKQTAVIPWKGEVKCAVQCTVLIDIFRMDRQMTQLQKLVSVVWAGRHWLPSPWKCSWYRCCAPINPNPERLLGACLTASFSFQARLQRIWQWGRAHWPTPISTSISCSSFRPGCREFDKATPKKCLFPVSRPTHFLEKIDFFFAQHTPVLHVPVSFLASWCCSRGHVLTDHWLIQLTCMSVTL